VIGLGFGVAQNWLLAACLMKSLLLMTALLRE
jgi:hypothetical protein